MAAQVLRQQIPWAGAQPTAPRRPPQLPTPAQQARRAHTHHQQQQHASAASLAQRHTLPTAAAHAPWRWQRLRYAAVATVTVAAEEPTIEPGSGHVSLYRGSKKPIAEFGYSRIFDEKYELGQKIGKGAMSTVHLGTDRQTGKRVAVKVMPKQFGADGFLERHFARRVRNEVDISARLGKSLNVCYYYGVYESDAAVHLVLELLSGGQLWDRVLKGEYGERQAARMVAEVLRTVAQCHAKDVMMRDIKPHNFMFASPEDDAPLKAVDFGISVFCKSGQYITQRAGTRSVMAPEVVRERYTLSADLWSAGIMAYLLLTGRLPYPFWEKLYVKEEAVTPKDMFDDICYAPLDFETPPWDTLSADAKEFVQSLLQRDEARRPTAEQALQHRWIIGDRGGRDVPLSDTIVQRLQRFGTYGRLKQLALRTVAIQIPQDSIIVSDLRGLFLELDPADSGRVPYTRLQEELEEGNFNLSGAEMQQLLAQMDVTPAGDITFSEFVASLVDWSKLQESSEWDALVERAFEAMDVDRCGAISTEDLELLLCGEEGCEAPDDLEAPLREVQLGQDACIGLAEFKQLLSAQLQDPLDLFESRLVQPQPLAAADAAPVPAQEAAGAQSTAAAATTEEPAAGQPQPAAVGGGLEA